VRETFDHASIPATLRDVFALGEPLTARDAVAASFKQVASLGQARIDMPTTSQSKAKLASRAVTRARRGKPLASTRRATRFSRFPTFSEACWMRRTRRRQDNPRATLTPVPAQSHEPNARQAFK
jgi:hypothetical protein